MLNLRVERYSQNGHWKIALLFSELQHFCRSLTVNKTFGGVAPATKSATGEHFITNRHDSTLTTMVAVEKWLGRGHL